jgi:hypothetical protein
VYPGWQTAASLRTVAPFSPEKERKKTKTDKTEVFLLAKAIPHQKNRFMNKNTIGWLIYSAVP